KGFARSGSWLYCAWLSSPGVMVRASSPTTVESGRIHVVGECWFGLSESSQGRTSGVDRTAHGTRWITILQSPDESGSHSDSIPQHILARVMLESFRVEPFESFFDPGTPAERCTLFSPRGATIDHT